MTDNREKTFDELRLAITQVLSGDDKDKPLRLTWLFEEFLYKQKKKKVPYEVYRKIRYAADAKTLAEYVKEFGLSMGVVHRIVAGTYFTWSITPSFSTGEGEGVKD